MALSRHSARRFGCPLMTQSGHSLASKRYAGQDFPPHPETRGAESDSDFATLIFEFLFTMRGGNMVKACAAPPPPESFSEAIMSMLIIRHRVKDYSRWRPGFDRHARA